MKLSLDKVYSTDEVAKKLGYTNIRSVYNGVRLGRLPKPYIYSGVWMFRKTDIDKIAKVKK